MPYSKTDVAALERLRDTHKAHLIRASWDKPKAALDRNHLARPYTGEITDAYAYAIKPASLSLAAIDVDYGSATFDFSTPIRVASKTPGRQHIYVFVAPSADTHKYDFATDTAFGEIIHQAKVNLWHPADFLQRYESTLPGVLVGWDELPAKWKWPRRVKGYVNAKLDELEATTVGRRNTLRDTALVVFSRVKADQYPGALAWQQLRTAAAATGLDVEEVEKTLTDAEDAAEPWKPSGGNTETLQWSDINDPDLLFDIRRDAFVWQGRTLDNEGELGHYLNTLEARLGKTTTLRRFRSEVLSRARKLIERDPFLDYLESLRLWDGTERLCGLLGRLGANTNDELVQWAGRAIFGVAVARACQPGYAVKETVILRGDQEIGKTPFLQFLVPTVRRFEWFGRIGALNDFDSRRLLEGVQGRVVCELEECEGLDDARVIDRVKSFLSATDDGGMRFSHRQDPESRPRRVVIVGTTNKATPLPADTGSSRFVVIECKPPDDHDTDKMLAELDADRDKLWAEALYRWKAGELPRLPRELRSRRDAANQRFMDIDEAAASTLEDFAGECGWTPLKTIHGDGASPYRLKRLRETAEQLGYEVRKYRNLWQVEMPSRDPALPF